MVVKGNHQFKVSQSRLWSYLMDPDVLAKITPGVSKLQVLAPDQYKSVSDIKIGPVKGSFTGKLNVIDKVEPNSFAIDMEQLSKIGNAHAKVAMTLTEIEDEICELSFNGKAKLSGVIARTGQRVLSGVANTITKEVFASLEQHIEEDQIVDEPEPNSTASSESEASMAETTPENWFAKLLAYFKKLFQ